MTTNLNQQFYQDWFNVYNDRDTDPSFVPKSASTLASNRYYKKEGKPLPSHFKTQLAVASNSTQTDGDNFAIQIKYLNSNQPHTLPNIQLTSTVSELKSKIHSLLSLPIDQQRLVFKGKPLMDSKTVQDYNIAPGSIIHLLKKAGNTPTTSSDPAPAPTKTAVPTQQSAKTLSEFTIGKLRTEPFWEELKNQLKLVLQHPNEDQAEHDIQLLIQQFKKSV